mmetsp:Transcript_106647/g.183911  ORF Transcript_106647/g.183911 Transcript_106647/m.183911 type:complete len:203 (-) Transcript_106647:554-1162(-)
MGPCEPHGRPGLHRTDAAVPACTAGGRTRTGPVADALPVPGREVPHLQPVHPSRPCRAHRLPVYGGQWQGRRWPWVRQALQLPGKGPSHEAGHPERVPEPRGHQSGPPQTAAHHQSQMAALAAGAEALQPHNGPVLPVQGRAALRPDRHQNQSHQGQDRPSPAHAECLLLRHGEVPPQHARDRRPAGAGAPGLHRRRPQLRR